MTIRQLDRDPANGTSRSASMAASEFVSGRYSAREVVGVFSSEKSLEQAIDELLVSGFDRSQISVLGDRSRLSGQLSALEDNPDVPTGAYFSASSRTEMEAAAVAMPTFIAGVGSYAIIIGSGGTLSFALAALLLAGAAGGGLGGLLAHTIARRHRENIESQIAAGGLVLWVSVKDAVQEAKALEVLKASGGNDIHVHEIAREWGAKDVPFYNVQPDPLLENEHRNEFLKQS